MYESSHRAEPPTLGLDFILKKQGDFDTERCQWPNLWVTSQLPTDILLIAADDDEFNACYSFIDKNKVQRSWCDKLGWVYFGQFGDENKVSLIRSTSDPMKVVIDVKNAAEILKPKVAVVVGVCSSMKPAQAKLGDVIIARKLATYDLRKASESGTEYYGPRDTISRNMGELIKSASDGWQAPLKSGNYLKFEIHRDAVMLSGAEVCDNYDRRQKLALDFPGALGLEREGAGLYQAAYDLKLEWGVIKGVSGYADGSEEKTKNWRGFASVMAASVVYHMFKYADVIKDWPHLEHTKHEKEDAIDEMTNAINILKKLKTKREFLPGKPFHKIVPRCSEVKKLLSIYESIGGENGPCLTSIYLTGPPGSGKTQLARQFGKRFLEDTPVVDNGQRVVLTINVHSLQSALEEMKKLLQQLNLLKSVTIRTQCDNDTKRLELYMEKLREILSIYPGEWLLILDNIFHQNIADKMPHGGQENWGNGKILVTTQNNELIPPVGHIYAREFSLQEGLAEDDALSLLREVSGQDTDKFASTLAKEVESFPLSLACVATYVGQMYRDRPGCYSWKQFLEVYRKDAASMDFSKFEKSNPNYPNSMAASVTIAARQFAKSSKVLLHAFKLLSYCTTNPIPLIIVSEFVESSLSDHHLIRDEIMREISGCSLLSNGSSSSETVESVKFHQVVGEALRNEYAPAKGTDGKKEYASFLRLLQKSLEKAIPDYDRSNVVLKMLASPHIKSIIDFGEVRKCTEHAEYAVILTFLADCLYHVSGVTENERISYCERAYEITHLPSCKAMNSIQYCQLHRTLGFYYREKGHLDKSEKILEKGLSVSCPFSKDENEEEWKKWIRIQSSLLNVLSWTYKMQMKLDDAEQTMTKSIKLAKIVFETHHQEIVRRLCNLAIIYREKEDLSKAREKIDEARSMIETTSNERDLTRAQVVNFSGKIYLRCAQTNDSQDEKERLLQDSRRFHAEALNIYEKVMGKNHIYVAGVCRTFGMVYKELNDYNLALEHVERAVKIYQDVQHPELSAALHSKTEVLSALSLLH